MLSKRCLYFDFLNVLLNKAVCQQQANWLRRAPLPGKGPLRKHFKSFIQCWLVLLFLAEDSASPFPPDLPYSRAHPL